MQVLKVLGSNTASADSPSFQASCCLLTTRPLCHRCAPTCLQLRATWRSNCSLLVKAFTISVDPQIECAMRASDFNQHLINLKPQQNFAKYTSKSLGLNLEYQISVSNIHHGPTLYHKSLLSQR